jgi:hypothetical protein
MKINFGTEKTITQLDNDGSELTTTTTFRAGEVAVFIKQYKIRSRVIDSKDEMTEFLRFTKDIQDKRDSKVLYRDKFDPTTAPAFVIEYPNQDDGSGVRFVVKCWSERTSSPDA